MNRMFWGIWLSLALSQMACTPAIKPWERGTLAKPQMSVQPNAIAASLRQHIHLSKEASSGGHGAGGGGCGCN